MSEVGNALKYIKKPIEYDTMEDTQIQQQYNMLFQNIKVINESINDILTQQSKEYSRKKHSRKDTSYHKGKRYDHYTYTQLQKQGEANDMMLSNLKLQYKHLAGKVSSLSDPQVILTIQKQLDTDKKKFKNLKLQIPDLKRKQILNQKKIKKGPDTIEKTQITLRNQYLQYLHKKDSLESKNAKVEEQNQNMYYYISDINADYTLLRANLLHKAPYEEQIHHSQHQKLLYETQKKKLNLAFRKNQRQQDTHKRKYYQLLKELEKVNIPQNLTTQKINQVERRIDHTFMETQMLSRIYAQLQKKKLKRELSGNQGFMLTEIKTPKQDYTPKNRRLGRISHQENNELKQYQQRSYSQFENIHDLKQTQVHHYSPVGKVHRQSFPSANYTHVFQDQGIQIQEEYSDDFST